jgi:hypothetical protein
MRMLKTGSEVGVRKVGRMERERLMGWGLGGGGDYLCIKLEEAK